MKKITISLVSLLVTSMFLIQATADSYDPWLDLNDDGEIDIFDVVKVAGSYGAAGTPINKTELLYEINATYAQLLDVLEILENRIDLLNSTITDLVSRVEGLENQTMCINGSATVGAPKLLWIEGSDAPAGTTLSGSTVTVDFNVEPGTPQNFTDCLYLKNQDSVPHNMTVSVTTAISSSDFDGFKIHIYENTTASWVFVDTLDVTSSDSYETYTGNTPLVASGYYQMTFEVNATVSASGTYNFDIQVRYE